MPLYNTVKKFYKGVYKYNIVLRLYYGIIFRGKDKRRYTNAFTGAIDQRTTSIRQPLRNELEILPQLYDYVMAMDDFATRYEQPRLHFYTNNYSDIEAIRDIIPEELIISIGLPPDDLQPGMVYMPEVPYEFRVTLGSVTKVNTEFVEWAEGNKNIRLQPRTKSNLESPGIYNSGTQLYVTGERNLLFVRIHLGNVNLTVERILN